MPFRLRAARPKVQGMTALYVDLAPEAFEALRRLAARELRHPRREAAFLILKGLERDSARREITRRRPGTTDDAR